MIKLIQYSKQAKGTRYDPKRGCYVGYRVDVHIGGRRIRRGGFETKKEARHFIERLRAAERDKKAGLPVTLSDDAPYLSQLFDKRYDRIESHDERLRAKRVFDTFLEVNGNMPVPELRRYHFQNYIDSRKDVKPETVNREMTVLSAALKQARDLFPELDAVELPRVVRPKFRRTPPKSRTISESEMKKIVEGIRKARPLQREYPQRRRAREPFARMFELCWLLGLRKQEAMQLKRADLKGRSLRVKRTKTNTVDILPHVPDRVVELLDTGHDPIFAPLKTVSKNTLESILEAACRYAGLEYGRDKEDGITFHRTRHSFISRLVKVTDIATAREYAGHSNAVMTAHYSHASDESKRLAMQRLYGDDPLKELFEQVRSGEMEYNEFVDALGAIKR